MRTKLGWSIVFLGLIVSIFLVLFLVILPNVKSRSIGADLTLPSSELIMPTENNLSCSAAKGRCRYLSLAQATSQLTLTTYLPLALKGYQFVPGTQLTFGQANDTEPDLSPDNRTVVFISDQSGQRDIYRVAMTGGPPINLTQTPLYQEDTPVFSPDGSKIAFASNRDGDWNIYLMNPDGSGVQLAIGYTGTNEIQPAFMPDGSALVFSSDRADGNWDIYSATIGSPIWTRLTSHPAIDRFPSVSPDGSTVVFRSERDGNSEIYLMDADGSHLQRITSDPANDGYPALTPDESGVIFTSQRSGHTDIYSANPSGAGLDSLGHGISWQTDTPRVSKNGRMLIYSARPANGTFHIFLRSYDTPLYLTGARGNAGVNGKCDWEAGTLAYGWIHAWQATRDNRYLELTRTWIDSCIPSKTNNINHVNDGLLGYAALVAYQTDGLMEHLAFAQQVADYLMNTAPRTADGTLTHFDDTVWDDTLLGTIPFLTKMSEVSGNSLYLEEAIDQVVKHANHLQDQASGLYHHAWDESHNTFIGSVYWGRGNGWALLADIEVLSSMPITHPLRSTVLSILQKQAAALRPLQDASGLWHTVVTRSDFYLESSASALIGYAFERGALEGWLSAVDYLPAARAARLGLWRKVLTDGTVTDVSAATGPMSTEAEYNAIHHDTMQLYGQGVAVLAESPKIP